LSLSALVASVLAIEWFCHCSLHSLRFIPRRQSGCVERSDWRQTPRGHARISRVSLWQILAFVCCMLYVIWC